MKSEIIRTVKYALFAASAGIIQFFTLFLYQRFVVYRKSIDTNEAARHEKNQA